jgi:hypothetical protein
MTASGSHVDVQGKSSRAVFARDSRRAVAVNYLLAGGAVAQHRVGVSLASAHLILAEFDHADFRMKDARVLNRLRDLLFVSQDEHLLDSSLEVFQLTNENYTLAV